VPGKHASVVREREHDVREGVVLPASEFAGAVLVFEVRSPDAVQKQAVCGEQVRTPLEDDEFRGVPGRVVDAEFPVADQEDVAVADERRVVFEATALGAPGQHALGAPLRCNGADARHVVGVDVGVDGVLYGQTAVSGVRGVPLAGRRKRVDHDGFLTVRQQVRETAGRRTLVLHDPLAQVVSDDEVRPGVHPAGEVDRLDALVAKRIRDLGTRLADATDGDDRLVEAVRREGRCIPSDLRGYELHVGDVFGGHTRAVDVPRVELVAVPDVQHRNRALADAVVEFARGDGWCSHGLRFGLNGQKLTSARAQLARMDAADFQARVEADRQTELDRLGSSKRLVALTDASLDDETVLRTAAASEAAAAAVFDDWAADATGDAQDVFTSFADRERNHYERVRGALDEDVDPAPGAVHDFLRDCDSPVERAGGVVGRGAVADRTLTQFVSYFVNQADESRADLFRELKTETQADSETAVDLLAAAADGDDDWDRALDAATGAIDAAYEEYVDALESMGVNAKSVC
jgi:hypothetical protein